VRQTPSSPPWSRGSGGDTQQNPKNEKKISNKAFHPVYPRLDSARQQKEESTELDEARLAVARTELEAAKTEVHSAQKELKTPSRPSSRQGRQGNRTPPVSPSWGLKDKRDGAKGGAAY